MLRGLGYSQTGFFGGPFHDASTTTIAYILRDSFFQKLTAIYARYLVPDEGLTRKVTFNLTYCIPYGICQLRISLNST
jgi:hypothetical protein